MFPSRKVRLLSLNPCRHFWSGLVLIALLLISPAVSDSPETLRMDALVLVNSSSSNYADFQRFVQPYLDHLGVPYSVHDIASVPLSSEIGDHALIIVGHRLLDPTGNTLDSAEQSAITLAVQQGTGLVNFDNRLTLTGTTPRYSFIQTIFNFTYGNATSGRSVAFPSGTAHFITENHAGGSSIYTEYMNLAGILGSGTSTVVATTGTQPFLATATFGNGRAVQWGTYNWMSHPIKGPMSDLDDLVWRSFVWASRKPFAMRSIPPFLTMRIDDASGPFGWTHIANEFGFRPWLGLFYPMVSAQSAADLSSLTTSGLATASVHAKASSSYFYRNYGVGDFSAAVVAQNFADATAWHVSHNIPISKYVVGHNYELGTNVFQGLKDWGVEFIGTCINVGVNQSGAAWLMKGPFRLYESGNLSTRKPLFYSDFLDIPYHPEFSGQFFDVITEIRDDAGYEWSVDLNDVAGTVGRGTRQTRRALNAKALAVLFSHEWLFNPGWNETSSANWRAILLGVTQNLTNHQPRYVTMDYAAQYLRALKTSTLTSVTYDPSLGSASAAIGGRSDLPTVFSVYLTDSRSVEIDVPAFTDPINVGFQVPSPTLDHFELEVTGSPQTVATPFAITVRAMDDQGQLVTSYSGTAALSDTTETVMPVTLGPFTEGVWTGQVSIGASSTSVTLHVSDGTINGSSNSFAVEERVAALTGVSVDPAMVSGGNPSTGTVWLDISAPVGGAVVVLSSSDLTAQVPATVTVEAGQTTATFPVTTSSVAADTQVTISALYNAVTQTATLTVTAPVAALASVTVDPATVLGGNPSTGTVTLDLPAPVGGAVVALSSSDPAAQVPATVTIEAGQTTATFPVTTSSVAADTQVTFSATYNSVTQTATLTVTAATISSLNLSPATLLGGNPSTGTVTLNGQAPAGGAVVTLSSDNEAAQVPATVTVEAGQTTATFPVTTSSVAADTQVTISALYNAVTQTATLTVTAPVAALASVTVDPATVLGGNPSTGTVTLDLPAPVGGAVVALSSSDPAAQVPATVTIEAGQTSASFPVTTSSVAADTQVTVSATYNSVTQTATLTVTAPVAALTAVSVDPITVLGGDASTGTVTLDNPAPAGRAVVALSSSDPAAQVPATVMVEAGQTSATFPVTTSPVAADTQVTVSATYNSVTQTAALTVTAATISPLNLSPATLLGGNPSTGAVTLNGQAPAGGAVVTLSSSDPAAQVPATVTVEAGQTSATFPVTTSPVAADTQVTISALYNAVTQTATLTVTAPVAALASVTVDPATVLGANPSTGTVTLDLPAPVGGASVALSTSDPAAQVPATVTVEAGQTTGTFPVTTSPVAADTQVTISAIYNAVTQTTTLTVMAPPAALTAVSVDPAAVLGGNPSTGTVTLDLPAPVGGAVVALSSSDPAAQVPATVTVETGQTSATFPVTTSPVAADTQVTISALYNAITQTATLTVTAPVAALASVTVDPAAVLGGSSSTGTVTLDLPVPVGGAVVALSSSNPAAQVPATVTVDAGQTTATFPVTTSSVTSDTQVTISASYNSVTQTTTLTLTAPPAVLTGVSVNPAAVLGGSSSTGTVTLDLPAPVGGAVVALSSSNPAAQVPATVTVGAGQTSATFQITTSSVTSDTQVTISASYNSVTQTTTLTVTASTATLSSVSLSPTTVVGGISSTGIVTLSGPASPGGALVSLFSSNAAAAQVPASVTVPGGASSTSFTVTTSPVASNTSVTISAVYNMVTQSAALTVTVSTATLSSISLSPETVVGGSPSTGTVTLSGPAPLGGALLTLFSSNTTAAQVSASVTVPGGASSASFSVTTSPVSSNVKPTISAAYRGTNVSARLTVMAPVLAAHTINPNSVPGETPSTGTVILSGPAPAGGMVVTLSSNNQVVQVPASVTVAAGATTATYTLTTSAVTSARTVTISARGGYVTVRADITVTP
jgi:hypothetical protein